MSAEEIQGLVEEIRARDVPGDRAIAMHPSVFENIPRAEGHMLSFLGVPVFTSEKLEPGWAYVGTEAEMCEVIRRAELGLPIPTWEATTP